MAGALLLNLGLGACDAHPATGGEGQAAATPAHEPPSQWEEGTSLAGTYAVAWRPLPSPVPLNAPFELEVRIRAAGAEQTPVLGAKVMVRAVMPAHGHGMVREPVSRELAGGLYRVSGMLMHMTGDWVLSIDAIVDNVAETTNFDVTLE